MSNDALRRIFARQRYLQEEVYGYDYAAMTDEERVTFIKDMVLAATDELHEALGEVGWKPWATDRSVDREAYVGELVDVLHFFVNLCLVVDLEADELLARYLRKTDKNIARQEQGYDGRSGKCPACRRAYDDEAVTCRPAEGALAYCQTNGFFRVEEDA